MTSIDQSRPTSGRPKLLFVDDHHLLLDALTFLAGSEYEVIGVDSLAAFEASLEQVSPNVAILDVCMPDGDGLEVAARVLRRRPGLKIMFLSVHTEPKIVKRAMDLGARAYLSKRVSADEVLVAIRTVLAGGKHIGSLLASSINEQNQQDALTERQKEVLRLISHGCSAKEIASRLNISVRTAEFHRAAIMERLKLHSTAMMTRYAVERGVA